MLASSITPDLCSPRDMMYLMKSKTEPVRGVNQRYPALAHGSQLSTFEVVSN